VQLWTKQFDGQLSPSFLFPSSHVSGGSWSPFPQQVPAPAQSPSFRQSAPLPVQLPTFRQFNVQPDAQGSVSLAQFCGPRSHVSPNAVPSLIPSPQQPL
jgi:hypothetical protein